MISTNNIVNHTTFCLESSVTNIQSSMANVLYKLPLVQSLPYVETNNGDKHIQVQVTWEDTKSLAYLPGQDRKSVGLPKSIAQTNQIDYRQKDLLLPGLEMKEYQTLAGAVAAMSSGKTKGLNYGAGESYLKRYSSDYSLSQLSRLKGAKIIEEFHKKGETLINVTRNRYLSIVREVETALIYGDAGYDNLVSFFDVLSDTNRPDVHAAIDGYASGDTADDSGSILFVSPDFNKIIVPSQGIIKFYDWLEISNIFRNSGSFSGGSETMNMFFWQPIDLRFGLAQQLETGNDLTYGSSRLCNIKPLPLKNNRTAADIAGTVGSQAVLRQIQDIAQAIAPTTSMNYPVGTVYGYTGNRVFSDLMELYNPLISNTSVNYTPRNQQDVQGNVLNIDYNTGAEIGSYTQKLELFGGSVIIYNTDAMNVSEQPI